MDLKQWTHCKYSSAITSRCDMFFTNDKQLRQEKEIPCMTMDDLQ